MSLGSFLILHRQMRATSAVLGVVLLVLCLGAFAQQKKTLVIVDDLSVETTHSMFFKSLKDRGYTLTFRRASDSNIQLFVEEEFLYDSLIIFASDSDNWNDQEIGLSTVLEFVDSGAGNVLIAGDVNLNHFVTAFADECGVDFAASGSNVIDHLAYDQSDYDGYHTLIVADNFVNSALLESENLAPVLYRGNGMSLHVDNSLVFPILAGSPSALCQNAKDMNAKSLHASGRNVVLVAGLQARNNARVVISGSTELFSDKFFASEINKRDGSSVPSGNQQFTTELVRWTFGERGLIRIKSIQHHLKGETESRAAYTIKDDFVYTVEVEEYNGREWVPYSGSGLQMELQMLDPYVRRTLQSNGNGAYSVNFQLPDVYGVFTLQLDYHRVGYTSLFDRTLVTILPFRHTDYERFILSAYPYYAGAFSMMGGVALFSFIFLFGRL